MRGTSVPRILVPLAFDPPAAHVPLAALRQWRGQSMGTSWEVNAWLPPGQDADAVGAGIVAVLDGIVARMSNWEAASDVSRFSRAPAGTWQVFPEDAFGVLASALRIARESGGAYDPSAGPLVDLWGFGPAGARSEPPSPDDVASARSHCRWAEIETESGTRRVRQPGGVSLDLCAIAKGHAVDAVSAWLDGQGIAHHLVEIGGELRGTGVKDDGMPWWVELESPPGLPQAEGRTLVALHGMSVATSGDYRRYFDSDGRRYAHTIDPRTGYPASHALASVTVLHPQCMLADAWSTALTVLGPQAGMALATRHGLAARFLVRTAHGFDEQVSPVFTEMLA
jgi:thiamine biosynthesis lipoprotein